MVTALGIAFSFVALHTAPVPPRVADAEKRRLSDVKALIEQAGLRYPVPFLYLRVFKRERVLEVWGAASSGDAMRRIIEIPICAASGVLGPKRKRGDLQVPEGFYRLRKFNPYSHFHLSLEIDYPNELDRLHSSDPGGDIYVHGDCLSVGCVAIENRPMEVVYLLATAAKAPVPIHLFPMKKEPLTKALTEGTFEAQLWRSLAQALEAFEDTHRVPTTSLEIGRKAYRVTATNQ